MRPLLLLATIATMLGTVALVAAYAPAPPDAVPAMHAAQQHAHHDSSSTPNIATDPPIRLPRAVHIRAWASNGTLLYSTWPGEAGLYANEDPEVLAGQPITWKSSTEARPDVPLWAPLLAMLDHAPPNATIRLVDHAFGVHKVGELELPSQVTLAKTGTLPRGFAQKALLNASEGTSLRYLAAIPLVVTSVTDEGVSYRFHLDAPIEKPVVKSVGLSMRIREKGDSIVVEPFAPTGAFFAHNNCALDEKLIEPGYYVLRDKSENKLRFDRYNTRGEFLLDHQRVTLEIRFFEIATDAPSAVATSSQE